MASFPSILSLLFLISSILFSATSARRNADILFPGKTAIQLKIFSSNAFRLNGDASRLQYHVQWRSGGAGRWSTDGCLHSKLIPDQSRFVPQPAGGVKYVKGMFVNFWVNTTQPLRTTFRIISVSGFKPQFSGTLGPFKATESEGSMRVRLFDLKNRNIVGTVKVHYLIIRPITTFNPQAPEYSSIDDIVYIGHRGAGSGMRKDLPEKFEENTIANFNYICANGAQAVELDVVLTSDHVPVLYHDFSFLNTVPTNSRFKEQSKKLSIKKLFYRDLQAIARREASKYPPVRDNRLFQKLENVFLKVNRSCGINVEIKYPQAYENRAYEDDEDDPDVLDRNHDLNIFIDTILKVLYRFAGARKTFISCFHADVITAVQLKQNRFEVVFLTSGNTAYFNPPEPLYYDPRATTVELGVAFAQSMYLKGLSLIVDDVTWKPAHISYIRSRGLTLTLWGDRLSNATLIRQLQKAGVDAFIVNELDRIIGPKSKPKTTRIGRMMSDFTRIFG